MTINLYRYNRPERRVEIEPLRSVVCREPYREKAVIESIREVIGNHSGPLALEFKETVLKQEIALRYIEDLSREGFRLPVWINALGGEVCRSLKEKTQEIFG